LVFWFVVFGLGPQPQIPNPQSPIPNPQKLFEDKLSNRKNFMN